MRKVVYPILAICAASLCFVVLRGTPLHGQQDSFRRVPVQLKTLPVKFDKEYGAAITRFGEGKYSEGRLHQMDATLVELPPGGKLAPHKHLAEEMIYIVSGKGYTNMWTGNGANKKRYDWSASDVLSPSLNVWHEHGNASSTEPARFLSMTSTPLTMRVFGEAGFVSSSDYAFESRWKKGLQEPKFLEIPGTRGGRKVIDGSSMSIGHFIPNMLSMKMPIAFGDPDYPEEGINVVPPEDGDQGVAALTGMAGNRLFEWQNREVIKVDGEIHSEGPHHHDWEVVYFCPTGRMITYITPPGKNQVERKLDWKEGDMFILESDEIHRHVLPEKGTRFLQFKVSGYFRGTGIIGGGMGPG